MQKKRILIVDDECQFTRMVRLSLEKTHFYEVCEVNHADRALTTARSFLPDLIFLDVMMPVRDGGDVASQIRSDELLKHIPIVFLTAAVSRQEAKERGLLSGGLFFLPKPVTLRSMVDCIEHHAIGGEPLNLTGTHSATAARNL